MFISMKSLFLPLLMVSISASTLAEAQKREAASEYADREEICSVVRYELVKILFIGEVGFGVQGMWAAKALQRIADVACAGIPKFPLNSQMVNEALEKWGRDDKRPGWIVIDYGVRAGVADVLHSVFVLNEPKVPIIPNSAK